MAWLATKEAAELLGYSERAIRNKAKNGEYVYRYIPSSTGRGGRKMEISMESLPEQAQKAYHNQTNGDSQFVVNTDYTSTNAQKKKGELRALAVSEYRKFEKKAIKGGMTRKGDIRAAFVNQWNKEHGDFQLTSKSLYDWQKKASLGRWKSSRTRGAAITGGKAQSPKITWNYLIPCTSSRQSHP